MPRRYLMLGVLTLILLSCSIDRITIAIVAQDLKQEFNLSDTQLGLLSGIAFALFYSVMGMPIARWADTGNRVNIISLATLLWSVGFALCSLATSFVQILLIRTGVAVGEAGCLPTSFSLLGDYFAREERARAISIYGMASALGFGVAALAGWLNDVYGWRTTIVLLSLPSVALAVIAKLILKEPRLRVGATGVGTVRSNAPPIRDVIAALIKTKTFVNLLMFLSVMIFFNLGVFQWQPSFFMRSFGLTSAQVGSALAIAGVGGGLAGALIGGELASRFAANNERLQLTGVALAACACSVLSIMIYAAPSPLLGFAGAGVVMFIQTAVTGPMLGTMQTVVPASMRAVAFALAYLIANLLGMGLGPLVAGMLSDAFRPLVGEESVRYALLAMSPGYFWAGWHAWRASRTVARDLNAVLVDEPEASGPARASA